MYSIIQGSLWCKGYSVGSGISQNFYSGTGNAIKRLKADMGIEGNSTVTLDIMKSLLSMQQYVLLKHYGGTTDVRNIQQKINREYKNYTGIIPCDGLYGREMNKALIQILQSWIQNTYIRPKIKAQIDEELNHENIVLPQRTTPRKTAQKATQQETFAQRQNKTGGRNAGKQNRR